MVKTNRLDALLNEYKGNFFEYLVSLEFSRHIKKESEFLCDLSDSFYKMLEQQESFIRNYFPFLIDELPKFAKKAVTVFLDQNELKYHKVVLAGKSLGASHDERFNEADILLLGENEKIFPISLKMAKNTSFVNTKSAGIRSFFLKYFETEMSQNLQDNFNLNFDKMFEEFSLELHAIRNIEFTGGFKQWEHEGFESLPGELQGECREHLLNFYHDMNLMLFDSLKQLNKERNVEFVDGIKRISGYSSEELIQLICFSSVKNNKLVNQEFVIPQYGGLKIEKIKKNTGSVDIVLNKFILQVRMKPMNKFTSKAYKVNCAIKYINLPV